MSEIYDVLENSKSIEILIVLSQHEKLFLSELLEKLHTKDTNTVNRRILTLREAGLLKEEDEEKFGGRRYLWLTKRGQKIASLLTEIGKL
jgi:DNA-binding HxlR family transcriptional regulator